MKKLNNVMRIFEMFEPSISGFQSVNDDNSKPKFKSSRKTRLTLQQIRKLRKMLDVRNYEHKINLIDVSNQYGPKEEESDLGMM
jgi:hypothetical protein